MISPHPVRLTVAIAALSDTVGHITLPPTLQSIEYLVTVQGDAPALDPPPWATRPDVLLVPVPGRGVSRNRNAGLAAATGDWVLFSDDDITLDPDGLAAFQTALGSLGAADIAIGWREGRRPVQGPRADRYNLNRRNCGHVCGGTFAVRRATYQALNLQFDTDFGVGAPYPIGEEYIFVTDGLRAGLQGVGLPISLGAHPHTSTGDNWDDPIIITARRAVLRRVYGRLAWMARLAISIKHRNRFATMGAAARFALGQSMSGQSHPPR